MAIDSKATHLNAILEHIGTKEHYGGCNAIQPIISRAIQFISKDTPTKSDKTESFKGGTDVVALVVIHIRKIV